MKVDIEEIEVTNSSSGEPQENVRQKIARFKKYLPGLICELKICVYKRAIDYRRVNAYF